MQVVGVLVWNGTDWEVPSYVVDGVEGPAAFHQELLPAIPALPPVTVRYVQINTESYQEQHFEWIWDVDTQAWVERWYPVATHNRPATHGIVQYVDAGITITSSTTTYIWSEPNWIVDTVVNHADDDIPVDNLTLYWADTEGTAIEYQITYIAVIDNSIPSGTWGQEDITTGNTNQDLTDLDINEKTEVSTGRVYIHTEGILYTFSSVDGWTSSALDEELDRPVGHDVFVEWVIDETNADNVLEIRTFQIANLEYPASWVATDLESGGAINRLAMTPYHGETRVTDGEIETYTYSFDSVIGWLGSGWASSIVFHNGDEVQHNGLTVRFNR